MALLSCAGYNKRMTDSSPHDFENIVQELTGCERNRTWSILVTIFGDLAQKSGDEISGSLLSSLTQPIGIKPQAMRVALHRLRRDGWIVTKKSGRTSKHCLSKFGLNQSVVASPHIYAKTINPPDKWHILIANPQAKIDEKSLISSGYYSIFSGAYIAAGEAPINSEGFLALTGNLSSIPKWLQDSMLTTPVIDDHSRLEKNLKVVERALRSGYNPTITETAVLRILIVHGWRRIVLRQPDMSLELFPQSPLAECRANVWKLLERLERPTLAALESAT